MFIQLIDRVYTKFQVSLKSITTPAFDWNTIFTTKRGEQKKTLKYSASPDAYDNRLNSASRKREVPAKCPRA